MFEQSAHRHPSPLLYQSLLQEEKSAHRPMPLMLRGYKVFYRQQLLSSFKKILVFARFTCKTKQSLHFVPMFHEKDITFAVLIRLGHPIL